MPRSYSRGFYQNMYNGCVPAAGRPTPPDRQSTADIGVVRVERIYCVPR